MDALCIYKKVQNEVQTIYRSRLQTQIFLSLNEGKQSLSQVRGITGSTSQAIIPLIRKFENDQLIEIKNHNYYLTSPGKVVTSNIADSIMTIGVVDRHKYFWSNHYLEGIPTYLLNEIRCLYNSKLISDTNTEIFNVYNNYLRILNEADHVFGVSSIMSTGHADVLSERVCEGIPVELIVTSNVAEQLRREPYVEKINALDGHTNFKLMVADENMRVGVTVTDKCLSLGLYKKDGVTYDTTTDLFSFDQMAVKWGERLFNYYRSRAKPF